MLNLSQIAARIRQPQLCQPQDIESLKTLCETYPYAQTFPLLYLKALAQNNDIRLETELYKYAYRIADRAILFDLLHTIKPENKHSIAKQKSENIPPLSDKILEDLTFHTQEKNTDSEHEKTTETTNAEEKLSFFDWLNKNTPQKQAEKPTNTDKKEQKQRSLELIDQFIEKNPKISSPKEHINKKNISLSEQQAATSIDENVLPVSETLAKIYISQGNFPRAIATYQQLCLLIPEKKVFFAEQIADLTRKING